MASKFKLSDTGGRETTEELHYDYDISENVVRDLVDYTRSRTVQNEMQFVITALGYVSGFMESTDHFLSGVLIGTAGAGKSHIQNTVELLMPNEYLYQATTGSDKSFIYDDTMNDAYVASMDELNKPSDELIEILKSLHGGEDEQFRYKVTGGGEGADRDVDEIIREAIPYWFLYAQYDPDFEMWDRLVKVPVHESREKNEAVARMQWDHSMISFGESDVNYIYDFEDGRKAIKDHIRETPKNAWVKIPAGEDKYGWDAFSHAAPVFDIDRSEVNRVSSQVANLVRSSALLNHKERETKRIKIRNEGERNVIIAEPQDLANVLSCRDVLLATTHQLDRKRRAICVAIQQAGGTQQAASINSIQQYLRKTNASFVKRSQVEAMLSDLQDNYLVEKMEGAGEGGRNLYKFLGWQSLGKFEITDEFKQVFDGCHNPFTGESFIETARRINDELTPKASDFMPNEEISVSSDVDASQQSQATLDGGTTDGVDVDLDPHEEAVYDALKETLDGEIITDLDEHDPSPREMLGVVPIGENPDEGDIEDTIFDPDHIAWTFGPDDWVTNEAEADKEVSAAIRKLTTEGILKTSVTKRSGNEPTEMKVTVRDIK